MTTPISLTANQLYEQRGVSDFFRILAASHPVDLLFYKSGKEVAKAMSVGEGYAEKFADGFDMFKIQNGANAQDVQVVARLGNEVSYDKTPVGDVNVLNTAGAFTQGNVAVGVGSTNLAAANPSRRYLEVINTDAAAVMMLNVDGNAPGAAGWIPVRPGMSWASPAGYAPTGAIKAKASAAMNATVVEG